MYGYDESDYSSCDICGSEERELNRYEGNDICNSCLYQETYSGEE